MARLLIGNHQDNPVWLSKEMRSWPQRVLWFAEPGDVLVLPCAPDGDFLEHVCSLVGVDPTSLRFHVVPPGRYGEKSMDPLSLTTESFVREVRKDAEDIHEVVPLWPSAAVARFADAIGVRDRLPGADFLAQDGVEIANSKACFRAFAAACGVPLAAGEVCREPEQLVAAINQLLPLSGGVMVKQANNAAGSGNEIVLRDPGLATGHAGGRFVHLLASGRGTVERYVDDRWDWASSEGRFPVVVEEFQPDRRTVYAEHSTTDEGVELGDVGTLRYVAGRLTYETVPYFDMPGDARERLIGWSRVLSEHYRNLGYRGVLGPDALLSSSGDIAFTEMNARFTGSTHLYRAIGHRVVDTTRTPRRTVTQVQAFADWNVRDLKDLLTGATELGLGYDPATRKGVVASMPVIPVVSDKRFLFSLVHETDAELDAMMDLLVKRFGKVPAA